MKRCGWSGSVVSIIIAHSNRDHPGNDWKNRMEQPLLYSVSEPSGCRWRSLWDAE